MGTRNDRTALDPAKASNTLRLRILDLDAVAEVTQAIQLAAWFGGLGSRSRNAFGSLHWEAAAGTGTPALSPLTAESLPRQVCRHDTEALHRDWPHVIGLDDRQGPLVWRSHALHPTWMAAMKELANQLRLRVHRDGAGYRGVIVHVPCGVPTFMRDAVHCFFDQRQELTRLGG